MSILRQMLGSLFRTFFSAIFVTRVRGGIGLSSAGFCKPSLILTVVTFLILLLALLRFPNEVKPSSSLRVTLPGGVELALVYCPSGVFDMGSPEDELGSSRRFGGEKRHRVTLTRGFYMGKYEVTQKQYQAVTGQNPSRHNQNGDCPVEHITWREATKFCYKLNSLCAWQLPRGYVFSLPSEAQWEYACRAGTTTAFNNGQNLEIVNIYCPQLEKLAWYDGNSNGSTHPVGSKQSNAWGIYDMHGNVQEFCRDYYGDYPGPEVDPGGPSCGSYRAVRGGFYAAWPRFCRSAVRGYIEEDRRLGVIGIRLVAVDK